MQDIGSNVLNNFLKIWIKKIAMDIESLQLCLKPQKKGDECKMLFYNFT